KADEKKYILMKIILLKWLLDHKIMAIKDIKENNLKEEFTFQKMLYIISGQKIYLMKEYHYEFSLEASDRLYHLLTKRDIFSTSKSTVLGIIYQYLNEIDQRK